MDTSCGESEIMSCSQACLARRMGVPAEQCRDVCAETKRSCSISLTGEEDDTPFPLQFSLCDGGCDKQSECNVPSDQGCEHACTSTELSECHAGSFGVQKGNSYLEFDYRSMAASKTVTYQAWVFAHDLSGWRAIRNEVGWSTGDVHWQFKNNKLEFSVRGASPTDQWFKYYFETNTWYHLSMVYADNKVLLYIDGELTETKSYKKQVSLKPTSLSRVGWWSGRQFDGLIRDVRMYHTALSAKQIANNYQTSATGPDSDNKLMYAFAMQGSAADQSDNIVGAAMKSAAFATADLSILEGEAPEPCPWKAEGDATALARLSMVPSEYQVEPPTISSDRVCSAVHECDFSHQFEELAPTQSSDRVCAELSVCRSTSVTEVAELVRESTPLLFNAARPSFDVSADGTSATRTTDWDWHWRVVTIGGWITTGRHEVTLLIGDKTSCPATGCNVAFGAIYEGAAVNVINQRFNHYSVSGFNQGTHGVEYLGNEWGVHYGDRLKSGQTVTIEINMDAREIRFAVDGVDQGVLSSNLPAKVKMAASMIYAESSLTIVDPKKIRTKLMYSRGSFGVYPKDGTFVGNEVPGVDGKFFNELFWNSHTGIIRRECLDCSQNTDMYFKRLTSPSSFNAFQHLLVTWSDKENVFGTDFDIYSSFGDALNDRNGWSTTGACNFNDENIAFPRDCGKHGTVAYTWTSSGNRYAHGMSRKNVRYSVLISDEIEHDGTERRALAPPVTAEFEAAEATTTSNRLCQPIQECATSEFEAVPPTAFSDRGCQTIATCSAVEYQVKAATKTSDTQCKPLTVCSEDFLESAPATSTSDRQCERVDDCAPINSCHELHGQCVDGVNQYTCLCGRGWEGEHCDCHPGLTYSPGMFDDDGFGDGRFNGLTSPCYPYKTCRAEVTFNAASTIECVNTYSQGVGIKDQAECSAYCSTDDECASYGMPGCYLFRSGSLLNEDLDVLGSIADSTNLVTNGDFNSGMSGWSEYKHSPRINGAHVHNFGSGHITGHLHGSCHHGSAGGIQTQIKTSAGTKYLLSVDAYSGNWNGANDDALQIYAGDLSVTDLTIGPQHHVNDKNKGNAKRVEYVFTAIEKTTTLVFYSPVGSCIDIDDIQVYSLSEENSRQVCTRPCASAMRVFRVDPINTANGCLMGRMSVGSVFGEDAAHTALNVRCEEVAPLVRANPAGDTGARVFSAAPDVPFVVDNSSGILTVGAQLSVAANELSEFSFVIEVADMGLGKQGPSGANARLDVLALLGPSATTTQSSNRNTPLARPTGSAPLLMHAF
jgi:hypothetical protein